MMAAVVIPDLPDIAARMAWALLLGSAVGFERQWHQKMAGLKTNALVALGASGFVCFATVAGAGNPSVVAAQIVTGIGFLGAGVIMREGINVHGLNTAATVWCSAMVGALCGFGMWQAGGVAASLLLGANIALRPVANWLNVRVQSGGEVERYYCLTVTCDPAGAPSVRTALLKGLADAHLPPRQIVSSDGSDGTTKITVQADTLHVMDEAVEGIVRAVGGMTGVRSTSWEAARAAPEA
jgi:putative Mg2+ transporter-C (MgtC) family protein